MQRIPCSSCSSSDRTGNGDERDSHFHLSFNLHLRSIVFFRATTYSFLDCRCTVALRPIWNRACRSLKTEISDEDVRLLHPGRSIATEGPLHAFATAASCTWGGPRSPHSTRY